MSVLSKGIAPIIFAILMVLIVVALSISFFQWSKGVSETFENTTKWKTESEIEKTQTSFTIVNVDGNQVGIKNNGRVSIDINHFSFYLNETKHDSILDEPLGGTSMDPADIFIFNITGFVDGDYKIRVTGPYGIVDEVFDELIN
ncbi:MAG: hypothetical protein KAT37_02305 [Candidatus Aenigmarchaeota archaeon]|nr:hypothetical protein [Candidatus Aenigmarchaeota archaeon]